MFYLQHADAGADFLTVGLFADFKLSESNYQTYDIILPTVSSLFLGT